MRPARPPACTPVCGCTLAPGLHTHRVPVKSAATLVLLYCTAMYCAAGMACASLPLRCCRWKTCCSHTCRRCVVPRLPGHAVLHPSPNCPAAAQQHSTVTLDSPLPSKLHCWCTDGCTPVCISPWKSGRPMCHQSAPFPPHTYLQLPLGGDQELAAVVTTLRRFMSEVSLSAGQLLWRVDDPASAMFIIEKGAVRVS